MKLEFGLGLPEGPQKGQINRFTDDLEIVLPKLESHFSGIWMTDHFFWDDKPTYEAWTVMAYLAARWPNFHIGPAVLGQGYRNPALLAKMGATLQMLSKGRFIMAIGAGWKEDEYQAYGYTYPKTRVRMEQLDDTLEILKRMWTTPGKVSYRGKHYHIEEAYCEPKPDPVPPIVVGGGGETTMLLAARHADWWNLPHADWTKYNDRLTILKRQCGTVGRDPATLRLSWFGRILVGKTEAAAQALDPQATPENSFVGTPTQIIEQMKPLIDAGVSYFIFMVPGLPDPEIIGLLTEEVLPKLRP